MKTSILVLASLILSLPAFAGQGCLTKEEAKELFSLQMGFAQSKVKNADCRKMIWGTPGCLPGVDLNRMEYLDAKANGDLDACGSQEAVESSDIQ